MILYAAARLIGGGGKPRASGDDPTEMRTTQTFFA